MDQQVQLFANDAQVGTATLTGLPTDRFPDDLKWLAPFIVVDGRYFRFKPNFTYGEQPPATYVEVVPVQATGTFIAQPEQASPPV